MPRKTKTTAKKAPAPANLLGLLKSIFVDHDQSAVGPLRDLLLEQGEEQLALGLGSAAQAAASRSMYVYILHWGEEGEDDGVAHFASTEKLDFLEICRRRQASW